MSTNLTLASQITDIDERTFQALLHINVVTSVVGVVGIFGNTINMAVFIEQGFEDSINISLFSLAISDFCTLLCLTWASVCMYPWYNNLNLPIYYLDGWNIGAFQGASFAYNDCWLAVFISIERSLSIVKPLQVREIITRRVTVIVVCTSFVVCVSYLAPIYFTMYPELTFDPITNKSYIHFAFTASRTEAERAAYVCYMLLQIGAFVCLTIATITLVVSLKRKTEWRQSATAVEGTGKSNQGGMNARDKKVIKMVVLISTIIIVCICPGLCLCFVAIVQPEFEVRRGFERLHIACWGYAFFPLVFNSTINILIYYNMSSKYRSTFHKLFLRSKQS